MRTIRKTGREHVSPETYKAIIAENEALRKELDARSAEQDAREKTIKDGRFDRLLKRDPAAAEQVRQHAEVN